MSIRLKEQSYGKSAVRFTKVTRDGDWHTIVECSANIWLSGQFEKTYTTGDNSQVIPTDTVKNTVYAIAKQNNWHDIEHFGGLLADHFTNSFDHVDSARITIKQVRWERIKVDGKSHAHAFVRGANESAVCTVKHDRKTKSVTSGLTGIQVLKTTASAFEGYIVDKYTTLPPATDRIFATTMDANWTWSDLPKDCDKVRQTVRDLMLNIFATQFSRSVQNTLYKIGEAILTALPDIGEITFSMPNQHRLLVDMSKMKLDNTNEIFCPTDEPYGDITATIARN